MRDESHDDPRGREQTPSRRGNDRGLSIAALVVAGMSLVISGIQAWPTVSATFFPRPTCAQPRGLVPVKGVSASTTSSLESTADRTYEASNTVDGDATTAWALPGGADGIGEQLALAVRPSARIVLACVINGYARSADLYARNARLRDVTVETAAGSITGTLINHPPDSSNQFQDLPLRPGETDFVRITIHTSYSGVTIDDRKSYLDICVSEILLYQS
jgi:hypothetical protein